MDVQVLAEGSQAILALNPDLTQDSAVTEITDMVRGFPIVQRQRNCEGGF